MKKLTALFLVLTFALSACGNRPQYKTRKGKKKQKYYNSIQYQMTDAKKEADDCLSFTAP